MYKDARIKRDLLQVETLSFSSSISCTLSFYPSLSLSLRELHLPRLRDPAHNPMAICRRCVNVTREIIKSREPRRPRRDLRRRRSRFAYQATLSAQTPRLRRHGTRTCIQRRAGRVHAHISRFREWDENWGKGKGQLSRDAIRGLEFQSRTESKSRSKKSMQFES